MRITGDEKHDENQIAEELENSGNKSLSVYLVRDDNGIVRTRSERENGIKRRICGKKLDLLSQPKILYHSALYDKSWKEISSSFVRSLIRRREKRETVCI